MFDRFWGKSMDELRNISFEEMHEFTVEFRELVYEMPFQVPQDLIFRDGQVAAHAVGNEVQAKSGLGDPATGRPQRPGSGRSAEPGNPIKGLPLSTYKERLQPRLQGRANLNCSNRAKADILPA